MIAPPGYQKTRSTPSCTRDWKTISAPFISRGVSPTSTFGLAAAGSWPAAAASLMTSSLMLDSPSSRPFRMRLGCGRLGLLGPPAVRGAGAGRGRGATALQVLAEAHGAVGALHHGLHGGDDHVAGHRLPAELVPAVVLEADGGVRQ